MPTATAAKPKLVPVQGLAPITHALLPKFKAAEKFLNDNTVERTEESELLLLCMIAGVDCLFLGDPGVAKTYQIKLLTKHLLTDAKLFVTILHKSLMPKHVLGQESSVAMKNDETRILTDGYLPSAHVGYLDEIFKAGAFLLNPLLSILAERMFTQGNFVQDCKQLIVVYASSNELPTTTELNALRDRIALTKKVEPIRTPDGRKAVGRLMARNRAYGIDTTGVDPFTHDEIFTIRREVFALSADLPEPILEAMNKAQQGWQPHELSQRRIGQMYEMAKACAWAAGRDELALEDLTVCQHMAFNHLTDADNARDVIVEIANEFLRKVQKLTASVRAELAEVDKIKSELEKLPEGDRRDQEAMLKGKDHVTKLRAFERDTQAMTKAAKREGRKTDDLVALERAIEGQKNWLVGEIYGVTD